MGLNIPINQESPEISSDYKVSTLDDSMSQMAHNLSLNNGLSYKQNLAILKKAKQELSTANKMQSIQVKASICEDSKRLIIVDIIVIFTVLRYIYKYLVKPFIFKKHGQDYTKLREAINFYFTKYTSKGNSFLFIFYLIITILFLALSNYQLQNVGIVMFISFITAIAASADQLLTGALLSGITIYIFIRIRTEMISTKDNIQRCNVSLLKEIETIYLNLTGGNNDSNDSNDSNPTNSPRPLRDHLSR